MPFIISPHGSLMHRISLDNNLHQPNRRRDPLKRPWYYYDQVTPVPEYRYTVGDDPEVDTDGEVSAGSSEDDLSDTAGEGKLPVKWSEYRYVARVL
jgi:hypothetical protein